MSWAFVRSVTLQYLHIPVAYSCYIFLLHIPVTGPNAIFPLFIPLKYLESRAQGQGGQFWPLIYWIDTSTVHLNGQVTDILKEDIFSTQIYKYPGLIILLHWMVWAITLYFSIVETLNVLFTCKRSFIFYSTLAYSNFVKPFLFSHIILTYDPSL